MKVFGITGGSGSGKTTLIEAMLPILTKQRVSVNIIKHSHHDIQLELHTKDSARLHRARVAEVMISSPYRFAIFHELHDQAEPDLRAQLATLVEGFSSHQIPRLEVFRPSLNGVPRYLGQADGVALASDGDFPCPLLIWPLNEPEKVIVCIFEWFDAQEHQASCRFISI